VRQVWVDVTGCGAIQSALGSALKRDLGSENRPASHLRRRSSKVLWIQLDAQSADFAVQLARAKFRPCNGHRNGSRNRMELPGHATYMPFVT